MREILFRGKTYDGKWEQGDLRHGGYVHTDSQTYIMRSDYALHNIPVDPKTVGQFTGLTDKNGNKIFEGDIVKIMHLFGWDSEQEKYVPEEEYISKVYSIDACPFCVDLQQCDSDMTPIAWLDWAYDDVEIEIIGNIHDNPKLLGGEQ